MTAIVEKNRSLAFLLTEAPGKLSRDVVTILAGSGLLEAGTILGKVTVSGKYTYSPNVEIVGLEGAGIAIAILAYGVDATVADVPAAVIIANDAEVKDLMLIFHESVNDQAKRNTKLTQLRAVGIKAR